MAELKYGNLITKGIVVKSMHVEVTAPKITFRGEKGFSFDWSCISEPIFMREDPHAHDFDEFLVFAGSDSQALDDFQAEIELSLGEEGEKHVITEPQVVYIPKGFIHCPLNFKRIDKPIVYLNIFLSPEYSLT